MVVKPALQRLKNMFKGREAVGNQDDPTSNTDNDGKPAGSKNNFDIKGAHAPIEAKTNTNKEKIEKVDAFVNKYVEITDASNLPSAVKADQAKVKALFNFYIDPKKETSTATNKAFVSEDGTELTFFLDGETGASKALNNTYSFAFYHFFGRLFGAYDRSEGYKNLKAGNFINFANDETKLKAANKLIKDVKSGQYNIAVKYKLNPASSKFEAHPRIILLRNAHETMEALKKNPPIPIPKQYQELFQKTVEGAEGKLQNWLVLEGMLVHEDIKDEMENPIAQQMAIKSMIEPLNAHIIAPQKLFAGTESQSEEHDYRSMEYRLAYYKDNAWSTYNKQITIARPRSEAQTEIPEELPTMENWLEIMSADNPKFDEKKNNTSALRDATVYNRGVIDKVNADIRGDQPKASTGDNDSSADSNVKDQKPTSVQV